MQAQKNTLNENIIRKATLEVDTEALGMCPWCSLMLISYSPECDMEHGSDMASFARNAGLFETDNRVKNHLSGIARYISEWSFVVEIDGQRHVTAADLRSTGLFDLIEAYIGTTVDYKGTIALTSTGVEMTLVTAWDVEATFVVVGTPCWTR